ncbi:MAG TPA: hypothetical protein VH255_06185, partial [Verrucomicrobiae bacterium]|nr:hypothetical protein [Verrucomicrobiae bacterium]
MLIVFLASVLCVQAATVTNKVLTTAGDLLSLSTYQASKKISVCVTGIVTVAEPHWGGRFIVQDPSGGVFVNNTTQPQPALGDVVEVTGISHPGGYAPDIMSPRWKKLGSAPLPEALPVSVEQLMSGTEDGLRIEVTGVVRSVHVAQLVANRLVVELASGGYRFRVFPPVSPDLDTNSLVGATVRLRGTATASFNAPLRHILTVVVFVPQAADFMVDRMPTKTESQPPITPLRSIAQYRRNSSPAARIRVQGTVIYQRLGQDIFLHEKADGLQVRCRDTNIFASGEIVEAV